MNISIVNITSMSLEDFIEIFEVLKGDIDIEEYKKEYLDRQKDYTKHIILSDDGDIVGYDRFMCSEWVLLNSMVYDEIINGGDFLARIKTEKRKSKIRNI